MADNDSTTDDKDSAATTDDFDLSAEDNAGNDPDTSTDDDGTGAANDPATTDDSTDKKVEDKTPALDTDLETWAEKKGYDKPETDRERKLLQDLRNGERDFTRTRQAEKTAADLAKTVRETRPKTDGDDAIVDPLEKEVKRLDMELRQERSTRLQAEYFQEQKEKNTPVTSEELEMIETILMEEAAIDPQGFEYLADPRRIGRLHREARARLAEASDKVSPEAVEKAKQEERERLAKLSKSGATSKSAKATTSANKESELDALWKSDD